MARSVRNREGHFINTQLLRTEALHFEKHGYYCPDPWGSYAWTEYWEEQLRRCKEGYSVGGVHITGDHYNYLNFSRIKITDKESVKGVVSLDKSRGGTKKVKAPDFWDGDYNYFHCLNIAKDGISEAQLRKLRLDFKPLHLTGGKHMTVLKARRKGFSYKNGAIAANRYNTIRNSVTIIGAYLKEYLYPNGTMGMVNNYLNFYNEHTGWAKKREYVDKVSHKKASYKQEVNGIMIEKGYKSEVLALSFKDNPDAARGKDGTLVLFEEAGKFRGLIDSLKATDPAMRDGSYLTGQIIIFGTGKGGEDGFADWEDFEAIYYNPDEYDMLPFEDIWSEESARTDGCFFFPNNMNFPGFIDKEGNSDLLKAKEFELRKRDSILKASGKGVSSLAGRLQEYCLNPQEAMLHSGSNDFPIVELKQRLNQIKKDSALRNKGKPVFLYRNESKKASYKLDLKGELEPLLDWKPKTANLDGCVLIYEEPVTSAPTGTYIIGYDPYNQNKAATSDSYGAVYVHKGTNDLSFTSDTLVASYVGRPATTDVFHRNLVLLSEIYNAEIMHENEVPGVRDYFRMHKKLGLLSVQPDDVINTMVKNSTVARNYGCHMTKEIKGSALGYLKEWLLKPTIIGEGDETLNLYRLTDVGLLTELVNYNYTKDIKGEANYDRISSMLQVMICRRQEELGHVYSNKEDKQKNAAQILQIIHNQRHGQSHISRAI